MRLFRLVLLATFLSTAATAYAQQGSSMSPAPIVFFDIAGPADARLASFYMECFGWEAAPTGNLSIPIAGDVLMGTLRADPAEKVIYVGVPDVTAALEKVVANGGRIHAPRFEVPGVVVLGLFTDPAGNRMGLVEMGPDGKNKVP